MVFRLGEDAVTALPGVGKFVRKNYICKRIGIMIKRLLFSMVLLFGVNAGATSLEVSIYKGTRHYRSDIVMTIRDGVIYRGTSNYNSDILATLCDGIVFSGRSSYRSDILFSFDGHLTVEEFVAVWHCVK